MSDPYLIPGSDVLANLLGITTAAHLRIAEADIVSARDAELARVPVAGMFDFAHLRAVHAALFGDVYAWAGEVRTVNISKGGPGFCASLHIPSYSHGVFRAIALHRDLRKSKHAEVVTTVATMLADLNALHPFREGNGRTQRAFLRQLAASEGWRLDWYGIDPESNVAACKASMVTSNDQLETLLRPRLTPNAG